MSFLKILLERLSKIDIEIKPIYILILFYETLCISKKEYNKGFLLNLQANNYKKYDFEHNKLYNNNASNPEAKQNNGVS